MEGREEKKSNDLFFTCGLVEYIARKTKNMPSTVVDCLGEETLNKIYELADVYHSDNIDNVSENFIYERHIPMGSFDNIKECKYAIPSHWDIGKVYKRLIMVVAKMSDTEIIKALMDVYHSKVSELIEDYNSSFYYDNPQTIFQTYLNGGIPE